MRSLGGKHRLVILGSGWGGFRMLRGINTRLFDVTVVSPRNHFVFTPLLASTAVGTLEFRCVTEPVKRAKVDLFEAACDGIDFLNKRVHCVSTLDGFGPEKFSVPYDSLVIATGAESNTFGIPGVKEHALFLKDVSDSRRIRSKIMECFEHASQPNITNDERSKLLHFAVVGGGPTGVEFMAELHDFITEDILKLYPSLKPYVSMAIYDVGRKILGTFDAKLGDYARDRFQRKGITLHLGLAVKEVNKDHFFLQNGERVDYGLLVWSTGVTPVPFIKSLNSGEKPIAARDPTMGRLLTDEYFRVLDKSNKPMENVYALGDCATIQGRNLPCTAQVANQKGVWLYKALNKLATTDAPNFEASSIAPFKYSHMGSLAYVGKWRAVVDMKDPTAATGAATPAPGGASKDATGNALQFTPSSGIGAWLFWRSAYFTMSVSFKNKIQIPMFWFLTWIFGRDISRIK